MALPGWSFLTVGSGIALLSLRQVLVGQKMGIFIVVGVGMALYGVVRMVRESGATKAKHSHEPLVHGGMHPHQSGHALAGRNSAGHGGAGHNGAAQASHVHASQIPRICSSCGAKNNPRANYCGHCGNRIRE